MLLSRRFKLTAKMWPYSVVQVYSFSNRFYCMTITSKHDIKTKLLFQDAVNAFCNGIIVRTPCLCHTNDDSVFLQQCHIFIAAILYPSVRMMYKCPLRVLPCADGFQ